MSAYIHMSSREMSAEGNLRTERSWRVQVIPGQGEVGDMGRGTENVLCEKNF